MGVSAVAHLTLPDTPYAMWVRGELADYLRLPEDGTRVEVVGGEIVVSPGPSLDHNFVVRDIERGLMRAELTDQAFHWLSVQNSDLNLIHVEEGYIPDLNILDRDIALEARRRKAKHLLPHEVEMVVEVTSHSNAVYDRPPRALKAVGGRTKWNGYAYGGIPYYLLVDRDPRTPGIALYGHPDVRAGTYELMRTWTFGETVELPEPFGFAFSSEEWEPWEE
jgi:hypothetical protein